MKSADRAALRACRPFAAMPEANRHESLRAIGMYSPRPGFFFGADNFDVRPEVDVGTALESATTMLKNMAGTLDMALADMDQDLLSSQAVSGALMLARQALGLLAVVEAVVWRPRGERTDEQTGGQS